MTENQLRLMYALILQYNTPEVLQSRYYPNTIENRINFQPTLLFTSEQLEAARNLLNLSVEKTLITDITAGAA